MKTPASSACQGLRGSSINYEDYYSGKFRFCKRRSYDDAIRSPFSRVGAKIIDQGFSAIPCLPGAKIPGERRNGEWRPNVRLAALSASASPPDRAGHLEAVARAPAFASCWADPTTRPTTSSPSTSTPPTSASSKLFAPSCRRAPSRRTGRKGYAGFFRASPSLVTATFDVDGQRAVDFLAKGRQIVVPPSLHKDTDQPYVWTGEKPLDDVTPDDLPILPDDFVERLRAALAPFGDVGRERRPSVDSHDDDYCGPWTEANNAALDNFDAWLPLLGVQAKRERDGSYRGPAVWRGGDNPTSVSYDHRGIRDFKMNEGLTPIDIVRRAGVANTEWDSDDWLREKLGLPVLQAHQIRRSRVHQL